MQRLKQLEDENRRLKQIVADQTLDIQALKAVVGVSPSNEGRTVSDQMGHGGQQGGSIKS
jgi:hypothetical protein